MRPGVHVLGAEALRAHLLQDFSTEAARATEARGRFAVALPGGSVAVTAFQALAGLSIDWKRVHFFWVDERAVPVFDPESNYGAARTLWLEPRRIPPAQIHRMEAEGPDLAASAAAYGDELTRLLGPRPRLDFVLLGMGPDGHVASL